MNFRYIIIIILIQIQIQTISSHREYHHNIKLRTFHKNNKNVNDSELSNICGKLCFACFILMILFYSCMTVYIIRYFWKKRMATRKSREIRNGLSNELRMYPQLYYYNNNRDLKAHIEVYNDERGWKGKKDEIAIALV
ncbi:hypothetical protein RclHR1_01720005 [Rhizophagus clarus]|uniref:PIR Superfamily Protein n=1 Tax=Rhizophagus clarus TaxID=94130 RepID=A0A2Z6QYD9_9GLOM|nr:hypothetical protein RclHR1_01720005 [Rhizophagus clarus]GES99610.1 hypothetical protein GLOIN_2v1541919 [Rhizophagus clarus]